MIHVHMASSASASFAAIDVRPYERREFAFERNAGRGAVELHVVVPLRVQHNAEGVGAIAEGERIYDRRAVVRQIAVRAVVALRDLEFQVGVACGASPYESVFGLACVDARRGVTCGGLRVECCRRDVCGGRKCGAFCLAGLAAAGKACASEKDEGEGDKRS